MSYYVNVLQNREVVSYISRTTFFGSGPNLLLQKLSRALLFSSLVRSTPGTFLCGIDSLRDSSSPRLLSSPLSPTLDGYTRLALFFFASYIILREFFLMRGVFRPSTECGINLNYITWYVVTRTQYIQYIRYRATQKSSPDKKRHTFTYRY